MSWLSSALSDIGLGGVNTFYQSAIKPALENPAVDLALALGAGAVTGGLALPALGLAGAGADVASAAPALGFAGDVGAGAGGAADVASFVANPAAAAAGGTTDLATAGGGDIGNWIASTNFGPTLSGSAPAAGSLDTLALGGAGSSPLDLTATGAGAALPAPAAEAPGIGSSVLNFLKNNAGLELALGGGVGAQLLSSQLAPKLTPKVPNQAQLTTAAQAAGTAATGEQQLQTELTQPLLTGQLPPAAEQSVQNAVNDAITTTKARYASLGLSGSTAETDAIANIQNQATSMRFSIAQQMAQTGQQAGSEAISALGLQGQIYGNLMQAQIAQDTALQNSIAQFTSSLALGTAIGAKKAA